MVAFGPIRDRIAEILNRFRVCVSANGSAKRNCVHVSKIFRSRLRGGDANTWREAALAVGSRAAVEEKFRHHQKRRKKKEHDEEKGKILSANRLNRWLRGRQGHRETHPVSDVANGRASIA